MDLDLLNSTVGRKALLGGQRFSLLQLAVFTEELGNGAVQLRSSGWALRWTGVFGSIFNYRASTSAILDITAAI